MNITFFLFCYCIDNVVTVVVACIVLWAIVSVLCPFFVSSSIFLLFCYCHCCCFICHLYHIITCTFFLLFQLPFCSHLLCFIVLSQFFIYIITIIRIRINSYYKYLFFCCCLLFFLLYFLQRVRNLLLTYMFVQ